MVRWVGVVFVAFTLTVAVKKGDAACDPRLPHCSGSSSKGSGRKDCPPFWLIPGKANDCTKSSQKLLSVDPNSVSISPSPIKLPGCFTLSMKVTVNKVDVPKSYFAKVEYNWWNLPQFSALPCQNASADGCGGYGNNCYYCDICNNLQNLHSSSSKSTIVNQFRNLKCPDKPGTYDFKREFCFNDFSDLDKDSDCKLDFLEDANTGESYQSALKHLKKLGYGTVVAKFTLAYNSTNDQAVKKKTREAQIVKTIQSELEAKRKEKGWALDDKQYTTFRNWYVQYRKDTWHKQEYLPWLLYYNQVGCLTVSFDVCDKQPTKSASGASGYQCG